MVLGHLEEKASVSNQRKKDSGKGGKRIYPSLKNNFLSSTLPEKAAAGKRRNHGEHM